MLLCCALAVPGPFLASLSSEAGAESQSGARWHASLLDRRKRARILSKISRRLVLVPVKMCLRPMHSSAAHEQLASLIHDIASHEVQTEPGSGQVERNESLVGDE